MVDSYVALGLMLLWFLAMAWSCWFWLLRKKKPQGDR